MGQTVGKEEFVDGHVSIVIPKSNYTSGSQINGVIRLYLQESFFTDKIQL